MSDVTLLTIAAIAGTVSVIAAVVAIGCVCWAITLMRTALSIIKGH